MSARPGTWVGSLLVRVVVPAWLLTGAAIKLQERSPMLLPSPVRDALKGVANLMGRGGEADFASFLDVALRVIVSGEFALAAAMITLPAWSRRIAIPMLSLFVLILLTVVARGEASCGCFGSKGPPPWAVLVGDAILLGLCLWLRPVVSRGSLGGCVALAAMGTAIAFGVPPRSTIAAAPPTPPPPPRSTAPATPVAPAQPAASEPAKPSEAPAPTVSTQAWPSAPAALQPYYLPQFEQWVGKRLRDQPVAALISGPIPSDLEKGRWIVMFFREDCEHCHAVLDRHFSPKVPLPTLLVSVPDADPAASLPNPCSECEVRTLPKGPDWVIGTPVLLSLEDGVVKGLVAGTDAEDPARVEALLSFR
jgi:hypothetical protein